MRSNVLSLALSLGLAWSAGADVLNVAAQRKAVDVDALLTLQRENIVCFYVANNSICRALYPGLQKLGQNPRLDIHLVDVGTLDSPTAKKYALTSIPYFRMYNRDGILTQEGAPAYKKVTSLIQAQR